MKLVVRFKEAHIWSNAFYLIPAAYAFISGGIQIGFLALIVFGSSTIHHLCKKTVKSEWWWKENTLGTYNVLFSLIDVLFSVLLALKSTALFFQFSDSRLYSLVIITNLVIALVFLIGKLRFSYNIQNCFWHFFSALTITLILMHVFFDPAK